MPRTTVVVQCSHCKSYTSKKKWNRHIIKCAVGPGRRFPNEAWSCGHDGCVNLIFVEIRIRGSHYKYKHPGIKRYPGSVTTDACQQLAGEDIVEDGPVEGTFDSLIPPLITCNLCGTLSANQDLAEKHYISCSRKHKDCAIDIREWKYDQAKIVAGALGRSPPAKPAFGLSTSSSSPAAQELSVQCGRCKETVVADKTPWKEHITECVQAPGRSFPNEAYTCGHAHCGYYIFGRREDQREHYAQVHRGTKPSGVVPVEPKQLLLGTVKDGPATVIYSTLLSRQLKCSACARISKTLAEAEAHSLCSYTKVAKGWKCGYNDCPSIASFQGISAHRTTKHLGWDWRPRLAALALSHFHTRQAALITAALARPFSASRASSSEPLAGPSSARALPFTDSMYAAGGSSQSPPRSNVSPSRVGAWRGSTASHPQAEVTQQRHLVSPSIRGHARQMSMLSVSSGSRSTSVGSNAINDYPEQLRGRVGRTPSASPPSVGPHARSAGPSSRGSSTGTSEASGERAPFSPSARGRPSSVQRSADRHMSEERSTSRPVSNSFGAFTPLQVSPTPSPPAPVERRQNAQPAIGSGMKRLRQSSSSSSSSHAGPANIEPHIGGKKFSNRREVLEWYERQSRN